MTSLSYGRIFCLESQKIDGTYQRYNHYFKSFLLKFYFLKLKFDFFYLKFDFFNSKFDFFYLKFDFSLLKI